MVFLTGDLLDTCSFLEILSPIADVLGAVDAALSIVTTMFSSRFIGKGGIFMTVTLLVVGVCGVKITSENQLIQPVR